MVIKICKICGKEFDARGTAKYCSPECSKNARDNYLKEYHKEYYKNNRDKINEQHKEYMRSEKGKEANRKAQEKWHKNNPEYQKEWYQNNKERKLAQSKKWREKNPGYSTEYARKNPDKYKKYREKNRDKRLIYDANYYKKIISDLNSQYDGDLYKILENIPNQWCIREAKMQVWFNESYYDGIIEKINITPYCEVTGTTNNLVIHHLYSFNTHPELGSDPNNMVRINIDVHKDFHDKFGYGNNTPDQWEKFIKGYGG